MNSCLKYLAVFLVVTVIKTGGVSGRCVQQHKCGPCRRHWDPICGSDGITYSNSCILKCVRRSCSPDLHILHEGSCEGSQEDDYLYVDTSNEIHDDRSGTSDSESVEDDEEEADEDDDDDDSRRRK